MTTTPTTVTTPAHDLLKAAYDQGRLTPAPILLDGGRQALVTPKDASVQIVDPVNRVESELKRIAAKVTVYDEASFIGYVNRYKSEKTQLFAVPGFINGGKAVVTADLDYHLPAGPQRREHFASYTPRYSEQWQRWHAACREPMKQVQFAELIEECRKDIVEPSAAVLLNIVRTFKANKKTDFDSVVYQPDGGVLLNYSEKIEQQGQSGRLPETMRLGIPVYFRGESFAVDILVRYRVGNGGVVFDLKLDRADVIEDEAFNGLLRGVQTATQIAPYLGTAS